ncbi:MAG: phosphoribosylanthranilate isomerase [Lentisphaeria bacterium]|nr:phosphoribosylanthranilate isomerase [Lentisphaeria bacterium]
MRAKICGIRTEEDLKAAVESGADAVGFLLGQVHPSKDFILPGTAARLVRALPPWITPVIVTHLTEPDEILELSDRTGITTLQLHGGSSPSEVQRVRDGLPPAGKVIVTIHPDSETDFVIFKDYYSLADAFLIDSFDRTTGRVGGTGKTNDWSLAAKFVGESPLPVILAGGLTPENAAEAIRTVRPYGLDANSGLKNKETGAVDPIRCKDFVAAVRNA